VIAILWHEGISGRNADDVTSVYMKAIQHWREYSDFVFWADNCAAQNKNWTIFSSMATVVNSEDGPNTITIKYLETGHTFMSAGSFHSLVEKSFKRMPNVYEIEDLKKFVQKASKNVNVLSMAHTDFRDWENVVSQGRQTNGKQRLANVQAIQFRKGSTELHYKTNLDDIDYTTCKFMKVKSSLSAAAGALPKTRTRPRGVPADKVKDIVTKLCPLMPDNRRSFGKNYPIDSNVTDLVYNYDVTDSDNEKM